MKTILVRTLAILLILGVEVLSYPPQERLMPDGAAVPEDVIEHEDSMASASEVGGDEYEDGDDSDMYMEPDGSEAIHTEQREEAPEESTAVQAPVEKASEHSEQANVGSQSRDLTSVVEVRSETKDQVAKVTQNYPTQPPSQDDGTASLETDSQNFFPSFAELFGNQRLPYTEQQQQRFRPNRFLGYFQRDRGSYQAAASAAKDVQHPLLGSGNFGVIRGGTYYPEDRENDEYNVDESLYNPYVHNGAARGRSHYYRNPKPQPVRGGDFFAHFRDFADITAPPKSSFSHLSVVYANKNGSSTGRITEPRNIIETLRMLEEEEQSNSYGAATTEVPRKKLSKGKRKLIKMKQYEDDKARRSRMSIEPLLALS